MKTTSNFIILLISLISCTSFKNIKQDHNTKLNPHLLKKVKYPVNLEEDYQTTEIIPGSIIMGYIIDGYVPSINQLKNISHLTFSFLRPVNNNGDIEMTPGWENIDSVIILAKKHNVKALISFGGGEFKINPELMGNYENRKNLIHNIISFIEEYNLDGFDCDWEPSWDNNKNEMELLNNTINQYYYLFIKEFRVALDAKFGKGSKVFQLLYSIKTLFGIQNKNKLHIFHKMVGGII